MFLKFCKSAKFSKKLNWDAVERPAYGYGMFNAALLAQALAYKKIPAIEFGVESIVLSRIPAYEARNSIQTNGAISLIFIMD